MKIKQFCRTLTDRYKSIEEDGMEGEQNKRLDLISSPLFNTLKSWLLALVRYGKQEYYPTIFPGVTNIRHITTFRREQSTCPNCFSIV